MFIRHIRTIFGQPLFHYHPDQGGGMAGDASAGTGGDAGAGGGQAGAGGQQQAQHTTIADENALVQFPGMDKPAPYKEVMGRYVPRDQTTQLIREIVAAAAAGRKPQGQQPLQGQQPQRPDPFAELEDMPLVDGKTVAALARDLVQNGFGSRDKVIKALQDQIKQLGEHTTNSRTQQLRNDFDVEVNSIIGSLPIPKTDAPIEGLNEALKEFVQGVFWKYDFESNPNARKEFGPTVKKEFEAMRKAFRALEAAELTAAEQRRAKARFIRPTGSTGPNGKPKLESNRELARRFFRGGEQGT